MKVLHVLNELRPSGAETMLRLGAGPWQERGLELEVLSVGDAAGPYAAQLAEVGYRVHHHPLRPVHRFLPSYQRLLRAGRFDVVHVHPERANFLLAATARAVGRSAVVRTVHNVFSFRGRLRLERQIQRAVLRRLGVAHVAVGESVAEMERRNFRNPTRLIRNTYDVGRFRPASDTEREQARDGLGLSSGAFVVAVIGNCSEVKNHRVLFEALAHPLAPASTSLLHVGLENESATGERRLAEELGRGDRVRFMGFVEDIVPVLRAADCYAMPSRYEGLAVTALEMLGGGVPAILADVPGLKDLRPHVPDAWWIEPRAEPLAEALADIARLPDEHRARWSRQTAATIRDRFGVERHVTAYRELYQELTGR
jgi:glycosyltransferase involved in cell wall biosynthesis